MKLLSALLLFGLLMLPNAVHAQEATDSNSPQESTPDPDAQAFKELQARFDIMTGRYNDLQSTVMELIRQQKELNERVDANKIKAYFDESQQQGLNYASELLDFQNLWAVPLAGLGIISLINISIFLTVINSRANGTDSMLSRILNKLDPSVASENKGGFFGKLQEIAAMQKFKEVPKDKPLKKVGRK